MQRVSIWSETDGRRSAGFAERRDFTFDERVRRAAKIFAVVFAIALVSFFIPILHFVLVPLFLIAAGVLAFTTFKETGEIVSGSIECPSCKHMITFTRGTESWPRVDRCTGCYLTLKFEKAGDAAN